MAKSVSINKWLVGGAVALAALCIHRKKGISGIGSINLQEIDLRDLVLLCNEIADRLQTNVKQVDYPQYRFSDILFYTDPFGGTYVCLHYDYNTGEIVNWYGEDYATLIHTKEQLEKLVERELYRELKGRYGESFADEHFEFLRKNNRIGKVEHSDYDGARVISKDGLHAISFDIYGRGENGITVTAEMKGDGSRYGFQWEFLSHIGDYKTLTGAIKAAEKYAVVHGWNFNSRDFKNI